MIQPKESIKQLERIWDIGYPRERYLRLDKNERIAPFPDKMLDEVFSKITPDLITMYPNQKPLYKKLSEFLNLDKSHLLLTPGSDAALKMIFETYTTSGDRVVLLYPTYAMARVYANMFQVEVVPVGFTKDYELKFDEFLEKIETVPKLIYLANPNQPTGTALSLPQIEILIDRVKRVETLLIIDEAYHEFSENDLMLYQNHGAENIVLLRTFSKALGLAGLRLGYIIAPPVIIRQMYKVKTLSDINLFALKFCEYILDNYHIVDKYLQDVAFSKASLVKFLESKGLKCISSQTNFIHIELSDGVEPEKISAKLKEQGILVQTVKNGLPSTIKGAIRITVGPMKIMKRFAETLCTILSEDK